MRLAARAAHRFRRDCLTQGGREPPQSPELGLHKPGQPPPSRLRRGTSVHENAPDPWMQPPDHAPVTRVWSNILTLPREHGWRQDPGRPIKVRYTRSALPNAAERWGMSSPVSTSRSDPAWNVGLLWSCGLLGTGALGGEQALEAAVAGGVVGGAVVPAFPD